jgi:hypothetical protein
MPIRPNGQRNLAIPAKFSALLRPRRQRRMKARVTKPGPLQNPATALAAWARFRRLMRWMFLITLTTVIGALSVLYRQEGMISVHFTSRWRWAWRWRCC